MNKSQIRKKILKIRKQNAYKSSEIKFQNIFKLFKKNKFLGKILGGYYPYNNEVNTINILEKFERQNYKISLPKIKDNSQMDFFHWSTKDPLSINKYGIPEPTSEKIIFPDILLVPIVAFDQYNNRVGYGGGFYDRYIVKRKKIITIGLAYSFQKIAKLPVNKHDIKLDYIVTDKEN